MVITVAAVLCQLTGPVCVEKIVAEADSMATCTMGEAAIVKWMQDQPKYQTGWRLEKWRCIPGHYMPKLEI